jgi:hypothetical protein
MLGNETTLATSSLPNYINHTFYIVTEAKQMEKELLHLEMLDLHSRLGTPATTNNSDVELHLLLVHSLR